MLQQFLDDLANGPLLDRIDAAAAKAQVPSRPTNAQISRMCNLWSRFDLIQQGEHPIIACISREIC